ncbi:hypothetical protein OZX72_02175 [Bifidobacterium sp. ESL0769]|uniref:hypothetical protein n=1 Tax=Bifidobacterium sp. ESL0769 TaxID=2983229 RepID=UPI0023F86685|nr:hypothetical protein [Bifidobacterium sp. ESL0769]WEV67822.1 hypothetical protein OZX72_02175 [Bifidobacterium sp. ESL0769]
MTMGWHSGKAGSDGWSQYFGDLNGGDEAFRLTYDVYLDGRCEKWCDADFTSLNDSKRKTETGDAAPLIFIGFNPSVAGIPKDGKPQTDQQINDGDDTAYYVKKAVAGEVNKTFWKLDSVLQRKHIIFVNLFPMHTSGAGGFYAWLDGVIGDSTDYQKCFDSLWGNSFIRDALDEPRKIIDIYPDAPVVRAWGCVTDKTMREQGVVKCAIDRLAEADSARNHKWFRLEKTKQSQDLPNDVEDSVSDEPNNLAYDTGEGKRYNAYSWSGRSSLRSYSCCKEFNWLA